MEHPMRWGGCGNVAEGEVCEPAWGWQVMVKCLRQLEGRIVGVVGLAHLDGMQRRWDAAWQGRQLGRSAAP